MKLCAVLDFSLFLSLLFHFFLPEFSGIEFWDSLDKLTFLPPTYWETLFFSYFLFGDRIDF